MTKLPLLQMITPEFGRGGGVGVSCERICGHYRKEYDVQVFVPDRSLPSFTLQCEAAAGLEIVRLGISGSDSESLQYCSDAMLDAARARTPAVVGGFYVSALSYVAAWTAGMLKKPLVLYARGNDLDLEPFGSDAFRIKFALDRAAKVYSVTRELAGRVNMFSPSAPVEVLPNGVDPVQFSPTDESRSNEKPVLGLFGVIKQKKGLEFLLGALDFTRCNLRIVGALREESNKALHGFLTLYPQRSKEIALVPFQKSIPDLCAEYHKVDVVCIPSLHEGMPNVMLEAMSCGKIVIASAVGGALDVIQHGENGFLFERGNEESFRAVLEEALAEARTGACGIAKAARATIAHEFSWKQEQARYLESLTCNI